MLRSYFPVFAALLLVACGSQLGQPHRELTGQWKASETYGGDTWTFRPDGTFSAEGARGSLASQPRSGRWGEKGGVLALDYTSLSAREKPTYQWKIEEGRLQLITPGNSAPSIILERVP